MYFVYVLRMSNGENYVGYTENLDERMATHRRGGNHTTCRFLPVLLIFYEAYVHEQDARRREQYLKTDKGRTTLKTMLRETLATIVIAE